MSDITVESTSDDGLTARSVAGDWKLTVDATNQNGPDPIQVLVANYVSCFVPALRSARTARASKSWERST